MNCGAIGQEGDKMDDEIKIQRINPSAEVTLTEAEMVALLEAGQWCPMPVRQMTWEEIEEIYGIKIP